jgi:hypothetical protein
MVVFAESGTGSKVTAHHAAFAGHQNFLLLHSHPLLFHVHTTAPCHGFHFLLSAFLIGLQLASVVA